MGQSGHEIATQRRRGLSAARGAAMVLLWCGALSPVRAVPDERASADASAASGAQPSVVNFDSRLLSGKARERDLSAYRRGNPVEPGTYRLDVYVNDQWQGQRRLRFRQRPGTETAAPCFERADLMGFGVDLTRLAPAGNGTCRRIRQWLPAASTHYDQSRLRYDITIPQANLADTIRGAVPRSAWSRGIDAGLVQYDFDLYQRDSSQFATARQGYLSFMAGFNLAGWQFRSDQIVRWAEDDGLANDRTRTFVQRPFPTIRSELTAGENFTDGRIFDSFGYRGVALASDDRMLPRSQRGYAPVVRGQANSNARVEIRQNGQLIYQTSVSPGPFAIRDLYPTGYGGDLNVTVIEASGRRRRFSVPYASVPGLLRPGISRYSLVAGQFREDGAGDPFVVQGTWRHGFTNLLTGYTGINVSQGYTAVTLGSALNTPLGAFALDVTHARTEFAGGARRSGQSYEATYSRSLGGLGTTFNLVAYRYSSSGYYELDRALRLRERDADNFDPFFRGRQRNRGQLSVNQRLGARGGAFYMTGSVQDYWNRDGTSTNYQAGYRNQFKQLTYGVSVENRRYVAQRDEMRVTLNLTLPLGSGRANPVFASSTTDIDGTGYAGSRLGLSSSIGRHQNITWNASISDQNGTRPGADATIAYRSPVSTLRAGYSYGDDARQLSLGARGSLVAHGDGLTFSPQQGENMVLVHAAGAEGARIVNSVGATINEGGYGLVAYATPYQMNRIQLDPSNTPNDIALETTSKEIVPWAGSITRLDFSTVAGDPILIRVKTSDQRTIPLGSNVTNPASGEQIGLVGQGNQIYFRSYDSHGRLAIRWGPRDDQRCVFNYAYDAAIDTEGRIRQLTAQCEDLR
ncbi:MAG: fimbrial protein [Xanthomonadales bacterium]|nr:fimbrial protein [Xanthomonadales bacterium]